MLYSVYTLSPGFKSQVKGQPESQVVVISELLLKMCLDSLETITHVIVINLTTHTYMYILE